MFWFDSQTSGDTDVEISRETLRNPPILYWGVVV